MRQTAKFSHAMRDRAREGGLFAIGLWKHTTHPVSHFDDNKRDPGEIAAGKDSQAHPYHLTLTANPPSTSVGCAFLSENLPFVAAAGWSIVHHDGWLYLAQMTQQVTSYPAVGLHKTTKTLREHVQHEYARKPRTFISP